jgi:signal transduction histidine kinase
MALVSPLLPAPYALVARRLVFVLSPLAAAASCMGARAAAIDAGRATWLLLTVGSSLAALGQALVGRAELLGYLIVFPSIGFHLLVAFHLAWAEGAILALRPAQEPRLALEIALDGLLVLLGTSAVVLRFVLDEPLYHGWLDLPQVVAMLIGQFAVGASLLFVALLVFWRDTELSGPVVDGLLVTIIFFCFGNVVTTLGLDPVPGSVQNTFDLIRLLGWAALTLTAALATLVPRPVPVRARRELAARRFRQLIIPGSAIFLTLWALDAVDRTDVSAPGRVVAGTMGILLAVRIGAALFAVEQELHERREAEQKASRARLRAVTAQMSPHFLFNALHSLSALVRRDVPAAEGALERLGGLLRYGLDTDESAVPFADEWSFARKYLDLESLRLGTRLTIREEIDDEVLNKVVPPFIVQPLVENAVRYGVSPFPAGGSVTVRARVEGDALVLEVEDSGPGATLETMADAPGVGIRGVRAQLETHFPQAWRMELVRPATGGFVVRLVMPAEDE